MLKWRRWTPAYTRRTLQRSPWTDWNFTRQTISWYNLAAHRKAVPQDIPWTTTNPINWRSRSDNAPKIRNCPDAKIRSVSSRWSGKCKPHEDISNHSQQPHAPGIRGSANSQNSKRIMQCSFRLHKRFSILQCSLLEVLMIVHARFSIGVKSFLVSRPFVSTPRRIILRGLSCHIHKLWLSARFSLRVVLRAPTLTLA